MHVSPFPVQNVLDLMGLFNCHLGSVKYCTLHSFVPFRLESVNGNSLFK